MNDRLQMPSAMPAELAERMSDIADTMRAEPTAQDLDFAKCDLVMEIEHGETRGGMDLEACLDCELNKTESGQEFIRDLARAIGNPFDAEECAAGYRLRVAAYLDRVVAAHIPESAVIDRAYRELEDA